MNVDVIKKIREETGAGVMEIKKALEQSRGNEKKVRDVLRKAAKQSAQKKSSRTARAGLIETYSHGGRIGVMIEVNCETDFVALNPAFKEFVHDVALQIVAMNPETVQDLFKQPFVKDESQTISQLLEGLIGKIGENIVIKRFTRYELGE